MLKKLTFIIVLLSLFGIGSAAAQNAPVDSPNFIRTDTITEEQANAWLDDILALLPLPSWINDLGIGDLDFDFRIRNRIFVLLKGPFGITLASVCIRIKVENAVPTIKFCGAKFLGSLSTTSTADQATLRRFSRNLVNQLVRPRLTLFEVRSLRVTDDAIIIKTRILE